MWTETDSGEWKTAATASWSRTRQQGQYCVLKAAAQTDISPTWSIAMAWGTSKTSSSMRIRDATNHGHRTVWTLGETPYFDAGAAREVLAESKDFDVVGGHLSPLPNTDYAANTEPDGTGTDITEAAYRHLSG